MTEPIIITAIIVAGVVAIAWVLLHFAFKAWKADRVIAASKPDYSVTIAGGSLTPSAAAQLSEETRRGIANGYTKFPVSGLS